MKASQLIHAMDREAWICIEDFAKPIDRMTIYTGSARGIKKDDPINRMHVSLIFAVGDVIRILAEEPRKKGKQK